MPPQRHELTETQNPVIGKIISSCIATLICKAHWLEVAPALSCGHQQYSRPALPTRCPRADSNLLTRNVVKSSKPLQIFYNTFGFNRIIAKLEELQNIGFEEAQLKIERLKELRQ